MKILFDHCTPRPFRRLLPGHEVKTVYEMGWADKNNGDLLGVAESQFDLFITTDMSIRHQQNLAGRSLAILLIPQVTETVIRHGREFFDAVNSMRPGEYRELRW